MVKKIEPDSMLAYVSDFSQKSSTLYSSTIKPFVRDLNQNNHYNLEVKRCSRQPPNILRFLNSITSFSTRKCKKIPCEICDKILQRNNYIVVNNVKIYFNANMNCGSTNVIFIIFCDACSLYYIGQTNTELRIYSSLHIDYIENEISTHLTVSEHIHACGSRFSIIPIYQSSDSCEYVLSHVKQHFIRALRPSLN